MTCGTLVPPSTSETTPNTCLPDSGAIACCNPSADDKLRQALAICNRRWIFNRRWVARASAYRSPSRAATGERRGAHPPTGGPRENVNALSHPPSSCVTSETFRGNTLSHPPSSCVPSQPSTTVSSAYTHAIPYLHCHRRQRLVRGCGCCLLPEDMQRTTRGPPPRFSAEAHLSAEARVSLCRACVHHTLGDAHLEGHAASKQCRQSLGQPRKWRVVGCTQEQHTPGAMYAFPVARPKSVTDTRRRLMYQITDKSSQLADAMKFGAGCDFSWWAQSLRRREIAPEVTRANHPPHREKTQAAINAARGSSTKETDYVFGKSYKTTSDS